MRHVPHLYLPGPFDATSIALTDAHHHHLSRVLRLGPGAPLTYTDGQGLLGSGVLQAGSIARGDEQTLDRPAPRVDVAVASPRSVRRQRFLVEKLAELGIDRLTWVTSNHTEGRPPRPEKAQSWAISALEQSRGAWLMGLDGPRILSDLGQDGTMYGTLWVAERETNPPPSVVVDGIIVIGPEGGLDKGEVPKTARPFGLGRRVLRTETAAIVAATLFLQKCGRLD